jgi:hypothetical protein
MLSVTQRHDRNMKAKTIPAHKAAPLERAKQKTIRKFTDRMCDLFDEKGEQAVYDYVRATKALNPDELAAVFVRKAKARARKQQP